MWGRTTAEICLDGMRTNAYVWVAYLVIRLTTVKSFCITRINMRINSLAYSSICELITFRVYLWNINALKIRWLSIFSIPFNFLKIYVYLGRIEYPCAVMQIVPLRKCTNFHGTASSMIVGDYSPDGAAFPFSIHLQTNCRLCLLDDIIAGRRLNGLTLMQNAKNYAGAHVDCYFLTSCY